MFRIFNYAQSNPQPQPSTSPPSSHNHNHNHTPSPIPSVRVEIPPSELLPGLTHNDLPLLGTRPSSSMLEYHQLPILRHLEWRIDETTNEPLRRPVKDVVSLTAAYAQTRGCEPPEPCLHCREGKSVWKTCVVGFDTREGMSAHGACAACRFSRRGCSFNMQVEEPETPVRVKDEDGADEIGLTTPPPSGSRGYLITAVAAGRSRGGGRGGGRARGRRFIRSRPYNLRPRVTTPTPSGSDMGYTSRDEERDSNREIKSERREAVAYSPGTSRLDGSILPFPLGPETIDDLPFLRRAVTEMEMHLGTLRRVRQLEDRERMRDTSINPWELV
ncbi:DUF3716 domain-containing protein [Aspergillus vadensis CBS 113365]|uniref:Uncharacterized protein n=1 Tax=Aspergillus vadensis (strain CBS 113365 / IMI 142717 / IBT 24658) TaxID=1448311 RepID=A0A319BNF1_ASPVC|nr:hypothetical protein BO88DRAFT_331563 [Aspergillus vadensis CBS 113365]PYH73309.1 hypothetical protein BO88DRAFT_331563 [Aspergillus vadensis CBS 113365]